MTIFKINHSISTNNQNVKIFQIIKNYQYTENYTSKFINISNIYFQQNKALKKKGRNKIEKQIKIFLAVHH